MQLKEPPEMIHWSCTLTVQRRQLSDPCLGLRDKPRHLAAAG